MVPRRTKKNHFPNVFYPLETFYFSSRPKLSLFVNIVFLKFQKQIFFAKFQIKRQFLPASRTVDKTENAKNNEIKILVRLHESLKSHKTVFTDNHSHKFLGQCETQTSFRTFYLRKNVLISSGKSNDVKIRIWSKSLGTRLLRATGFIEIP